MSQYQNYFKTKRPNEVDFATTDDEGFNEESEDERKAENLTLKTCDLSKFNLLIQDFDYDSK